MKTKWDEKSTAEKIMLVLRIIIRFSFSGCSAAAHRRVGQCTQCSSSSFERTDFNTIYSGAHRTEKSIRYRWLCLFCSYACYDYRGSLC